MAFSARCSSRLSSLAAGRPPPPRPTALRACRGPLVGEGYSAAKVRFTQQAPFPSHGKLLAFNGTWRGRPAILAHIYGPEPAPTSVTIPSQIESRGRGTYGTVLSASLPSFSSPWGYITEISINLGRCFSYRGRGRSYLSAGCPTPSGVPVASFPLTQAKFGLAGRDHVQLTLTRSCRASH